MKPSTSGWASPIQETGRGVEKAEAATKLASAVDFIAAHILPYWGGIAGRPGGRADHRSPTTSCARAHPGKRIVIAEFGWPSAGYNMHRADPGRIEQAMVLRDFVARAEAYGIDYNIIEAFDQPWKTNEGGVGMYWGMFDASRNAKFAWSGLVRDPDYWKVAGLAVLLGLLLSLPLLARARTTAGEAVMLAVAANAVGAWFATVFAFWQAHYFVPGAAFALGLGVVLLIPLVVIALARIEEIAAIAFGRSPRRLIAAALPVPQGFAPKVSIHVPAHREPPEMLKATLDAVARLDYPNFECVVVINNTPDPAFWRPIEDHCRALGERFKFINEDNVTGYKAGALRLALAHTASDAEIIGVIDADYVVHPDWLKDLVPAFADPKVGMIQAPQDHRDGERTLMHHAMNGEYAGFFDIGMVQRNEANAIIVHGTMCLIRRDALDLDRRLVERHHRRGHRSRPRRARARLADPLHQPPLRPRPAARHLRGLQEAAPPLGLWRLPDPQEALAAPAAARARAHARAEARIRARLAQLARRGIDRRRGRDPQPGLGAGGRVRRHRHPRQDPHHPDPGGLRGVAACISSRSTACASPSRSARWSGAVFAAMSVQWTVARAVGYGVWKESLPFTRTAKGGTTRKGPDFPAFWEAVMGALLLVGAAIVVVTNYKQIHEINIFALVLVVQSLPFLAAVAIAAVEGSRFNDFAYWRSVEAKVVETLPRPAVVGEAPAQLPADNRIETVQ